MSSVVPKEPYSGLEEAARLLLGKQVCVLTGAGISTESGIPDYRGPERRTPANPMKYREFAEDPEARRRYWSRSAIGWHWMRQRLPNQGHRGVTALEQKGLVTAIITQNVDGLHQAAGATGVIELHGGLRSTVCLECGTTESRESVQERIEILNPGWTQSTGEVAPDGDVHLPDDAARGFVVPACLHCGGRLKPDVVFFGESVPAARVDLAFTALHHAQALLVLGSSLTVYSGYRFVDRALRRGMSVVVLNDGETRADEVATIKVACRLGESVGWLAGRLPPNSA